MTLHEKAELLASATQIPFTLLGPGGEAVVQRDIIPNCAAWIATIGRSFDPAREVECVLSRNLMCIGHVHTEEAELYIGPVSTIKCDAYRIKGMMETYHLPKDSLDATMQYFRLTG